jgi:hypothetical protein
VQDVFHEEEAIGRSRLLLPPGVIALEKARGYVEKVQLAACGAWAEPCA